MRSLDHDHGAERHDVERPRGGGGRLFEVPQDDWNGRRPRSTLHVRRKDTFLAERSRSVTGTSGSAIASGIPGKLTGPGSHVQHGPSPQLTLDLAPREEGIKHVFDDELLAVGRFHEPEPESIAPIPVEPSLIRRGPHARRGLRPSTRRGC